jgi:carbamoyl-phosphate synthase small subunit
LPPVTSLGMSLPSRAVIVLEDGTAFRGEALAGQGAVGGEIVFNTGMSGYQEIATDPSYCGQIMTYTFPMNGNYGADPDRDESDKAHTRAIIAREITNYRFNRASRMTWLDWLADHGVLAVSGVDTRALTRHIREKGALRAVVSTETDDVKHLRKAAQGLPRMGGLDLARVVTCSEAYAASAPEGAPAPDLHVVAYDYGIKRSMLRHLATRGFRVTVVPAQTSAREVLKRAPDGVFLSNGPGDPAAVTYAVKAVERLLGKVPIFGICLGHQLLAQALGMKTFKLKFGHRGANHPVKDLRTNDVEITTQNHGFAVRDDSTDGVEITHLNLNDGTVEGVAAPERFAFSVQYHPESTPGPHDSLYLFDRFRDEIARFEKGRA